MPKQQKRKEDREQNKEDSVDMHQRKKERERKRERDLSIHNRTKTRNLCCINVRKEGGKEDRKGKKPFRLCTAEFDPKSKAGVLLPVSLLLLPPHSDFFSQIQKRRDCREDGEEKKTEKKIKEATIQRFLDVYV